MKKNFLIILLISVLIGACNSPDIADRKQGSEIKIYKNFAPPVKLSGDSESGRFNSWQIPSIAISRNYNLSLLYTDGAMFFYNPDINRLLKMASTQGYLYAVVENSTFPNKNWLYKFDYPAPNLVAVDLTPGISWTGTNAMTAVGGYVYAVQGTTLWKVNTSNGSRTQFSAYPTGWLGTVAMTNINGYLYAVQGPTLYRVNISTGAVTTFSAYPNGWQGTVAMAATNNGVFAVQGSTLYRVDINNGSVLPFSAYPNGWTGTLALAASDGYLYAVQDNSLWKVSTFDGSVVQLGTTNWAGTNSMTVVTNQ